METRLAAQFSVTELIEAFNAAFHGYFVPIHHTEQSIDNWRRVGDIDLERSLVWTEVGAVAGFSFLGRRGRRGWIGGFGILPDFRGQGLAYRFFDEHLAYIRKHNLAEHLQLECFVQNWATKVYERAGFVSTRRLLALEGRLPSGLSGSSAEPCEPAELRNHERRIAGAYPPPWQRERRVIHPEARCLRVGPAEAPTGMLAHRVDGETVWISGAAADEPTATVLLQAVAARSPGKEVKLGLEPEGSPLHLAMRKVAAAQEPHALFEMHWNA